MENNYYTPEISDIRVGYEHEAYFNNEWKKYIIETNDNLRSYKELINSNRIRVGFLTKEQIEAEGWKLDTIITTDDDDNDLYNTGFSKYLDENNWYSVVLYPENKILIQKGWYRNEVTWLSREVFYGECKSINEFRYITEKLLKI